MHKGLFFAAVATTVGIALLAPLQPSQAQTFKPVDSRIVNTASQPVPVTVLSAPEPVGEGGREVHSPAYALNFGNNFLTCVGGEVPAGKRFVVEHISAFAGVMGAAALVQVSLEVPSGPRIFIPAAAPVGSGMGSAGQVVRLYLDGVFLVCATANNNNNGSVTVALNGYLVKRP
jgi:hypothetical protein